MHNCLTFSIELSKHGYFYWGWPVIPKTNSPVAQSYCWPKVPRRFSIFQDREAYDTSNLSAKWEEFIDVKIFHRLFCCDNQKYIWNLYNINMIRNHCVRQFFYSEIIIYVNLWGQIIPRTLSYPHKYLDTLYVFED